MSKGKDRKNAQSVGNDRAKDRIQSDRSLTESRNTKPDDCSIRQKITCAEKLYDVCFQTYTLTVSRCSYAVVLNGLLLTAIQNRIENIEYANMGDKYIRIIRLLLSTMPIMSLIAFVGVLVFSLRYLPMNDIIQRSGKAVRGQSDYLKEEIYFDDVQLRTRVLTGINRRMQVCLRAGLIILMMTCILVYGSSSLTEILEYIG